MAIAVAIPIYALVISLMANARARIIYIVHAAPFTHLFFLLNSQFPRMPFSREMLPSPSLNVPMLRDVVVRRRDVGTKGTHLRVIVERMSACDAGKAPILIAEDGRCATFVH